MRVECPRCGLLVSVTRLPGNGQSCRPEGNFREWCAALRDDLNLNASLSPAKYRCPALERAVSEALVQFS
jgi:hypothetical protein